MTIICTHLVIDLGNGLKTNAQLTYPAVGKGPFPGILLVHGADLADISYGRIFWQTTLFVTDNILNSVEVN